MNAVDAECIANIRVLAMETITNAKSGHPGISLGAAPLMYALFGKVLKKNGKDPSWFNRDRFILSAGHASALFYVLLHLSGYDVTIEDLKNFRRLGSRTPGHPEYGLTPGVDATSGPLGQGLAMGTGTAIAEEFLRFRYHGDLFSYYTYVLCGDGDLQEGIAYEAFSLAGRQRLNKLIVLYDSNDVQLDGPVKNCFGENTEEKMKALGFSYFKVEDGEDIDTVIEAIERAKENPLPSFIEIKTVIGKTALKAGTADIHGNPLEAGETAEMRKALGGEPFGISEKVRKHFEECAERDRKRYEEDKRKEQKYAQTHLEAYREAMQYIKEYPKRITAEDLGLPFESGLRQPTRKAAGDACNALSRLFPLLLGGSADLSRSTYIKGADGDFDYDHRAGRNINFGVREHAMAAVCNGIVLNGGTRAFCSGFLVFADYLKPALRMAALMGLPVIYCFSHDSIAVGEDGPTHQPVEQLTMLRSIPNVNVIRPSGREETKEAFAVAAVSTHTPTVIVTSRQATEECRTKENADENLTELGAYVIMPERKRIDAIIIATGSETALAVQAQRLLLTEGIDVRVVSAPSFFLFDKQSREYREKVLPLGKKIIGIEMSDAVHLRKYLNGGPLINIETFGASGRGEDVIRHFGFTAENVARIIKENL